LKAVYLTTRSFAVVVAVTLAFSPAKAADDFATPEQKVAAQRMIQLFGYQCQSVSNMLPYIFSHGWTVSCNNGYYSYELADHGGKWSVTAN